MRQVKEIRKDLDNKVKVTENVPGYYTWWFDKEGKDIVLKALPAADSSRLKTTSYKGKTYYALYFGISKELLKRIRWHVAQKHSASSVRVGTISTLRHTFGAILGKKMIESEEAVNRFMDAHCLLEYHVCESIEEANAIETNAIQEGYFPLNISKNNNLKEVVKQLKALRKKYGK